jgi:hypothetical protein
MNATYNINFPITGRGLSWAISINRELVRSGISAIDFSRGYLAPKPHLTLAKLDDMRQGISVLEDLRHSLSAVPQAERMIQLCNVHISPLKRKYIIADAHVEPALRNKVENTFVESHLAVPDFDDLHLTLAMGAEEGQQIYRFPGIASEVSYTARSVRLSRMGDYGTCYETKAEATIDH